MKAGDRVRFSTDPKPVERADVYTLEGVSDVGNGTMVCIDGGWGWIDNVVLVEEGPMPVKDDFAAAVKAKSAEQLSFFS